MDFSARDDIPDVYMVSVKTFHLLQLCPSIFLSLRPISIVKVRSLIEDIRDVRFHKVETDLEAFNGRTIAVKVICLTF